MEIKCLRQGKNKLSLLHNYPSTYKNSFQHTRTLCTHAHQYVYISLAGTIIITPRPRQLVLNLQYGCTIGYEGPQFSHCSSNLPSASVLDTSLASECSAGRMLGPFESPPLPNFHCSSLGIIPKHDGGWCTIYHLSAPHGTNINDYIDSQQYSLSYCTLDDAFAIVNSLGKGALMAKIDLKNAFLLMPLLAFWFSLCTVPFQSIFLSNTLDPSAQISHTLSSPLPG